MQRFSLILILLFCFFFGYSHARSKNLRNFYENFWEVNYIYSIMSRTGTSNDIPGVRSDNDQFNSFSYSSVNFAARADNEDQWDMHFDFQNRYIGDLVNILYHTIAHVDEDDFVDRFKDNHIHNGFFGEMNLGVNVIGNDELVISAGLNFGDYLFENSAGIDSTTESGESDAHHAWYIVTGAYGHVDYAITDWLAFRLTTTTSMPVYKKATLNANRTYTPVFLTLQPELFTSEINVFLGADFLFAFLDDPTKQKRIDIKAGIRF
ncbi:MAG: hypothetical protein HQK83_09100 [Fibrobacteria bacterium]|nr:hypothetical protein [Fibrobacteria bacterium]